MARGKGAGGGSAGGDGRQPAITHQKLSFDPAGVAFRRADLVFDGVDHSSGSYEVRVFLNNDAADGDTPRSPEQGYAGRFSVFGHGDCFGAEGHCEPPAAAPGGTRHPLNPQTRILTITEPLRRIVDSPGKRLESLTFVPIAKAPRRADCKVAGGLFKCARVSLRTYR